MKGGSVGEYTCVVCGKHYHMCRNCANSKIPYVAWRATACCPACYAVSETINAHFYGRINSVEAKQQLDDADWRSIDHMLPDVQEYIEKVMDEAAKAKSVTKRRKASTEAAGE